MRERLEKFMKNEGLTPSRFAEIMSVQPSSISHILNGRNKPSYDFLAKFLMRFPKVNPDWLILGKNPMYRETFETPVQYRQQSQLTDEDISEIHREDQKDIASLESAGNGTLFTEYSEAPIGTIKEAEVTMDSSRKTDFHETELMSPIFDRNENSDKPKDHKNSPSGFSTSNHTQTDVQQNEEIESIVLFYRNNTFRTFRP